MTTTLTPPETRPAASPIANSLTAGKLPNGAPWMVLGASLVVAAGIFGVLAAADGSEFNWVGTFVVGAILYIAAIWLFSRIVEGGRRATDRLVTALVTGAFVLAMIPLVSLAITVVSFGLERFDAEFFTYSMRNVTGEGGGAVHAIIGTLLMTGTAALISIPIGLMTSIYLVEYGRGRLAQGITFLVDVMTGIPSIVAGLFAYALFAIFWGPGTRTGIAGAVALTVLMIPVVVRSSEEMLKLVPNELREAALALGVPRWKVIARVVLPTAFSGIITGVLLGLARVMGETAPLLILGPYSKSINTNLFDGNMAALPTMIAQDRTQALAPALDRVWAAALTLVLLVLLFNLAGRAIARRQRVHV